MFDTKNGIRMKVITFFNEKGGVGKTTLTALFASWLAYNQRCRVEVFDCDYPSYQLWNMQKFDVKALREDLGSEHIGLSLRQMCRGNDFYKVRRMEGRDVYGEEQLRVIAKLVSDMRSRQEGYLLMDFPGRFLPNDPVYRLSRSGLLDLVVFPVDSDRQSRAAAISTYTVMRKVSGGSQRCAVLWNRESLAERKAKTDRYADSTRGFEELGIPVIKTRVRDMLIARRDSSAQGFIRNTLCWPQPNIDRTCPWIEDAFLEIRSLADRSA